MDRSTLQRNIQPLIERGLVRLNSAKAGRSRSMSLTPQGRKAAKAAVPLWNQAQRGFVRELGPDRWRLLRDGLSAAVTAARRDAALGT